MDLWRFDHLVLQTDCYPFHLHQFQEVEVEQIEEEVVAVGEKDVLQLIL